ncbi:MBL fold metallo-hydrolase [Pseudalkalibacillus hwajinpoensis]|uniref:MBL fold metallo-hydrolase n=1 Tax=Guptibacillus hwajinpoensis TaxID=208199 RepID=UPI00325ABA2F
MEWKQMAVGPVQANAGLIWNEKKEALLIDPGAEGGRIKRKIEKLELKPVAILLTHAHFDHIGAVDLIREAYNIPVYLHKFEEKWLSDASLNGSKLFPIVENIEGKPADYLIENECDMTVGSFMFSVFETPGHSPGSVSFYFKEAGIVFSGDALFAGSIGRTDLPGGNHKQLIESIHNRLLVLPEQTIVASGHGPVTTIEDEMAGNPFLNGFSL